MTHDLEGWTITGDEREARWIERARSGEAEAFDALVRRHQARLRATALRLLGNHEDAEDLTQECFVRACRGLAWYRADGSFAGWLRRILVHLALDRFRRRDRREARLTRRELALDEAPAGGAEPAEALSGKELGRLLTDAIEGLPEGRRVALLLRVREGLAYREVARALGVSEPTARTQVLEARRTLLARLGPHLDRGPGERRADGRQP